DVDLAGKQRLDRFARRVRNDLHLHLGTAARVLLEQRRQPVIRGIARRAEAQQSLVSIGDPLERAFGSTKDAQRPLRGTEQAIAGQRRHEPSTDAMKERRSQSALELDELMAERRLRQIEMLAGVRQRPVRGNRLDELEMLHFENHVAPSMENAVS